MINNKKTRKRENHLSRKEEILNAAIGESIKIGYQSITRDLVAVAAGTSRALVTHYFPTMEKLKYSVMKTAIEREIISIIAQGLSVRDAQTKKIKKELRKKVATFFY